MSVLERWIRSKIGPFGFSECDVRYSLGYCQGDGVSFIGNVDLKELAPAIGWSTDNLMLVDAIEHGEVKIHSRDSHYVHANTMRVDWETSEMDPLLSTTERLLDGLSSEVGELALHLAKSAESECYSLIEATPYENEVLWERSTNRFKVQIVASRGDDDLDLLLSHYDDDALVSQCQAFIDGSERYGLIQAVVYSLENGQVTDEDPIAESSYLLAIWPTKRPIECGAFSEQVGEVCELVRSHIG